MQDGIFRFKNIYNITELDRILKDIDIISKITINNIDIYNYQEFTLLVESRFRYHIYFIGNVHLFLNAGYLFETVNGYFDNKIFEYCTGFFSFNSSHGKNCHCEIITYDNVFRNLIICNENFVNSKLPLINKIKTLIYIIKYKSTNDILNRLLPIIEFTSSFIGIHMKEINKLFSLRIDMKEINKSSFLRIHMKEIINRNKINQTVKNTIFSLPGKDIILLYLKVILSLEKSLINEKSSFVINIDKFFKGFECNLLLYSKLIGNLNYLKSHQIQLLFPISLKILCESHEYIKSNMIMFWKDFINAERAKLDVIFDHCYKTVELLFIYKRLFQKCFLKTLENYDFTEIIETLIELITLKESHLQDSLIIYKNIKHAKYKKINLLKCYNRHFDYLDTIDINKQLINDIKSNKLVLPLKMIKIVIRLTFSYLCNMKFTNHFYRF